MSLSHRVPHQILSAESTRRDVMVRVGADGVSRGLRVVLRSLLGYDAAAHHLIDFLRKRSRIEESLRNHDPEVRRLSAADNHVFSSTFFRA